jgi:hypothetical protein
MSRLSSTLAASVLLYAAGQPALAGFQAKSNDIEDAKEAPADAPGWPLGAGAVFIPFAFGEVGYDSNLYQSATRREESGYIRSGAGFTLAANKADYAGKLQGSISGLSYFDQDVYDPNRLGASVSGVFAYKVAPGWTVTPSGSFVYDAQSLTRSQVGSGGAELGYTGTNVASYLRGRYTDTQYLNSPASGAAAPFFLTSDYNYDRADVTWGVLYGASSRVLPYFEANAARVDYTNQPRNRVFNRDGNDYYVKGGLRMFITADLSVDAGWRANLRDTDDARFKSYDSNFVDASITWRASPFFLVSAAVERVIAEPTDDFSILADVKSYALKMTYLPVAGVGINLGGGWQQINQIGFGSSYHSTFVDAQVTWDYNTRVQFYTALRTQYYSADWQFSEFTATRIMAGIRVVPDGANLLNGESLGSLATRFGQARTPSGDLDVSFGYAFLHVPEMRMATVVGGPFYDKAIGRVKNDDGDFNGARIDARLSNFARAEVGGRDVAFGVSGFYAGFGDTTKSHCAYSLKTDCAIVNIVDFDAKNPNNTGPFGDLHMRTERDIRYYGVSLDFTPGWISEGGYKDYGGYKDTPVVIDDAPLFRFGVSLRGLDERTKLVSHDFLVCDPVKYKEFLDTQYYGGYVGVSFKREAGWGWTLDVDATGGLYYASTQYQGRYSGYAPVIGLGYLAETGSANDSRDDVSFIGGLRAAIQRETTWGKVGVYAQGEYLSYVPRMAYNNNDRANFLSFPIAGNQQGTQIKSGDGYTLSTGVSVKLNLN